MSATVFVIPAVFFALHGIVSFLFGSATIKKGYQGLAAGILTFFAGIVGMLYAIALPSQPHRKDDEHDFKVTLGVVIFVLAFLATLGGVITVIFVEKSVNDALKGLSQVTANQPSTEEILSKDLEVSFGSPSFSGDDYDAIFSVPVTLTNTSMHDHTFTLTLNAKDSAGNTIDSDPVVTSISSGLSYQTDVFVRYGESAKALLGATFSVEDVTEL